MEGAEGRAQVSLNEDDFPTRPPEVNFRANSLDGSLLPATRNKRPTSLATSVIHRPREPVLGENSCERRHIQLFISEEDDSPVNHQLLAKPRNETHHQLKERLTNPERERISADQLSQPQNRNAEHIHERNRSEGAEEQTQPLLGNTNSAEQDEPVNNLNRSSEQDIHIWRSVSDQSEQSQIGNSNSSRRKAQIVSRKEATEARKAGYGTAAADFRWGRSEAEQRADSGNFSLLAEHINRNILACFICSAKFVDPKVKVVAFFKAKMS
jgi:hypothetical protein